MERMPLLSDIPLIGELFKSRSRSRSKTNLMVFIRPDHIAKPGRWRSPSPRTAIWICPRHATGA